MYVETAKKYNIKPPCAALIGAQVESIGRGLLKQSDGVYVRSAELANGLPAQCVNKTAKSYDKTHSPANKCGFSYACRERCPGQRTKLPIEQMNITYYLLYIKFPVLMLRKEAFLILDGSIALEFHQSNEYCVCFASDEADANRILFINLSTFPGIWRSECDSRRIIDRRFDLVFGFLGGGAVAECLAEIPR